MTYVFLGKYGTITSIGTEKSSYYIVRQPFNITLSITILVENQLILDPCEKQKWDE